MELQLKNTKVTVNINHDFVEMPKPKNTWYKSLSKKGKKKRNEAVKNYRRRGREKLHDWDILEWINRRFKKRGIKGRLKVKDTPENLIELVRSEIKLYRTLNKR